MRRRGDNLTRENVMKQAASIHDLKLPMLLPGITVSTSADDFAPIMTLGAAFAGAIVAIYMLVVAQFGSFKLPLVVLTPIPLTLIGIMFGHWLFGAPFTATSMIGFIALAGIIVCNSILLVDFIRHGATEGGTCARCCWMPARAASNHSPHCSHRHDRSRHYPACPILQHAAWRLDGELNSASTK